MPSKNEDQVITKNTGLSVALVALIVASVWTAGSKLNSMENAVALLGSDIGHMSETITSVNAHLQALTDNTQREIKVLQERLSAVDIEIVKLKSK